MHLMKRAMAEAVGYSETDTVMSLANNPIVLVALVAAIGVLVGIMALGIFVVVKRRSDPTIDDSAFKRFTLPTNIKPVIKFKSAAGPGGLKNSPSPLGSPEGYTIHGERVQPPAQYKHGSYSPEMSPVDDEKVAKELQEAAAGVEEERRGVLNFSMRYAIEKSALQVTIHSASDLPPLPSSVGSGGEASSGTTSPSHHLDPYVKLQLLPEKQHKVKTRVVRNTINPVYDEEFTFYGITHDQLQSTTLHFAVVAFDRYSRDEIVGEVVCPLHQVDLSDSDQHAELSLPLISRQSKFQSAQERGELLLSMYYQPGTQKITIVVLKAKNLPQFEVTGMADPYVKVYMLYNGQKVAKKKTHVKKRTLTPVYNESFVFDLPSQEPQALDAVSFEFAVMDWDRVTKNEIMGRCQVGLQARGQTGRQHWEQVRRTPHRQIAEWHRLRP